MRLKTTISVFLVLAACSLLYGDTLRLVNGASLQGTFLGANTREVRFMGPDGAPKVHSIYSIAGVAFGTAAPDLRLVSALLCFGVFV